MRRGEHISIWIWIISLCIWSSIGWPKTVIGHKLAQYRLLNSLIVIRRTGNSDFLHCHASCRINMGLLHQHTRPRATEQKLDTRFTSDLTLSEQRSHSARAKTIFKPECCFDPNLCRKQSPYGFFLGLYGLRNIADALKYRFLRSGLVLLARIPFTRLILAESIAKRLVSRIA